MSDAGDAIEEDAGAAARPCDTVACGQGACVDATGVAVCVCDEHIVGAACDSCAAGYTGASCATCAEGYLVDDASGACLPDPCADSSCGEHATCRALPFGLMCICDVGFAGADCGSCADHFIGELCDACEGGYELDNDACVPVGCVGANCGAHGSCTGLDDTGGAQCACDRGYEGALCDACTDSYVMVDGECVSDECSEIVCDHGHCSLDDGAPVCHCLGGFIGDACDSCPAGHIEISTEQGPVCENTLPQIAGLVAWFDARYLPSLTYTPEGGVTVWDARNDASIELWNYKDSHFGEYNLIEGSIQFDGDKDLLVSYDDLFAYTDTYSLYVVADWAADGGYQVLWSTVAPMQDDENHVPRGLDVEILANGSVRASHKGSFQAGAGDEVIANFFPTSGRRLLRVERQAFLNGHTFSVSDGTHVAAVQATEGPFIDLAYSEVASKGGYGEALDGKLFEILVLHGQRTAAEHQAIESYLRVKWDID